MLIIGVLLGVLFLILAAVNISSQIGLQTGLPSQIANAAVSLPELVMWILLIVGGFFLWIDVSRRTKLFNGAISFVVGALAIGIGLYPLLINYHVLNWTLIIPRWIIPWLSLILGGLLVWDNIKVS
ncbi:MAG TPA: hypothetical protein VJJ21_03360 [Candidatus Nanoarchaeia archaeon]|nr:hypothetical protein [Candidatus Nanoarchaeia archaeon]